MLYSNNSFNCNAFLPKTHLHKHIQTFPESQDKKEKKNNHKKMNRINKFKIRIENPTRFIRMDHAFPSSLALVNPAHASTKSPSMKSVEKICSRSAIPRAKHWAMNVLAYGWIRPVTGFTHRIGLSACGVTVFSTR